MTRQALRVKIEDDPVAGCHEIIDVRAPCEFEEDHITGAVNLPVLNNAERERVGTIYKQDSSFDARKVGAALVSANIAAHLKHHFANKPADYTPLVYCWRGGQRSGSLSAVLSTVGWEVKILEGGYRAYRRMVIDTFAEMAPRLKLVVLNGYTGAGKTLILKHLQERGIQALDLEGLACHKGSVFGGDPENPQPPQKRFESLLYDELREFDLESPVFIEAESAKIGRINLPNPLWQKMKTAPVVEIDSPLEARAEYLRQDYEEWLGDLNRVFLTLDRLKGVHSKELLDQWRTLAKNGSWQVFVRELLAEHYDKRYTVGGTGHFEKPGASVSLKSHDPATISKAADDLIEKAQGLFLK